MNSLSLVGAALAEDIGAGDITSRYFLPAGQAGVALVVARACGVLSGMRPSAEVLRETDVALGWTPLMADGDTLTLGSVVARIEGPSASLLAAERTLLNFLQRLSGVATLTRRFVEAVQDTGAIILDTRKTTPGWRLLEKESVRHGGGSNHRIGLHDAFLVKDNHLAALAQGGIPLADCIRAARQAHPSALLEIEADTPDQAALFAELGVDRILLDNMTLSQLRESISRIAGRAQTEASGGITLETARQIAQTGVQFLSVGALTHSPPSLDLGLDWQ